MCDHCGCREFPPIAELSADHETILDLAWTLAEAAPGDAAVGRSTRDELTGLLDRHVAKEETGLYPALLVTGGATPEKVSALESEHSELRRSLTDGIFDRRDFFALAAHIEDEEMELFPAAMLGFEEPEWDATSDAHRAVDADPPTAVR